MCLWRWVPATGALVTSESPDAGDAVWDLVGERIVSVDWWAGPPDFGCDPVFRFANGGQLALISDAYFDTWVMRLPEVTLVGPMC